MYVAAYRRRPAAAGEEPEVTRRRKEHPRRRDAIKWLAEQMRADPRAEIGAVRRPDGEVVRVMYAG